MSWLRVVVIVGTLVLWRGCVVDEVRAAQSAKTQAAVVEGVVRDGEKGPIAGAVVSLEGAEGGEARKATSDAEGKFRFEPVARGTYTLRAKLKGYVECNDGPFVVGESETKSAVLVLMKDVASSLEFSDEPAFTVAGVTDTTAMGGHGSGPVTRNSNALSKETVSLATGTATTGPEGEAAIRAAIAREDHAELHKKLAEILEAGGKPLDAVKEYQRAAEMEASEAHLFAWGAELLLHHAPEPAIEVFGKGRRLYPQSTRMLLGLGAALYAQRAEEKAVEVLLQACDVNPKDATPYLFLGRVQVTQATVPAAWTERMKRFVELQPGNARAHYLYAVALLKESGQVAGSETAEEELREAIRLDAGLGEAYVELGIVLLERGDLKGAEAALRKGVELLPEDEQAHYRLAQAYRKNGEMEKANQEIAEFKRISAQRDAEIEKERHEIPQFVYTLRGDAGGEKE